MNFNLENKVALVTGASKGIGEAIARALAAAGARVVLSSRNLADLDAVAADIRQTGGEATGIAAHAGKPEQLAALVEQTVAAYGGVDILVNNAATNPVFGPVLDAPDSAFDKIMEVNVKGPLALARLVYPLMKARGGGSIVNISSVEGLTPSAGLGLYSISKSALIMLTKVLAQEWGPDGIRANAICPGLIKTKFSEALWSDEKILKQYTRGLPLGRMGTVEEIAGLALLLASPAGGYCTGAVFTADGGMTV